MRTGDYKAIQLLLRLGWCAPKLRPCIIAGKPIDAEFALSAFELAVKIGDPESIKLFLAQNIKDKKRRWLESQAQLNQLLSNIPDFTFQCKWDCESSWIPFFRNFMPNRSYWLFKRGSSFRLTAESTDKSQQNQTFVYNSDRLFYMDYAKCAFQDIHDSSLISEEALLQKAKELATYGVLSTRHHLNQAHLLVLKPVPKPLPVSLL